MSPIRAADPLAQVLQSVVILDSAFRAMIPILLVALGDMICGRTGVFQISLVLAYGTVSRCGDPIVLGIAVNLLSVGLTGFLLTQIFDVRGVFRNPRIGRRDAGDQHHPSGVRSSTRVRRASQVSWSPTRARQRRALRPSDRPHGDGGLIHWHGPTTTARLSDKCIAWPSHYRGWRTPRAHDLAVLAHR